MGNCKGCFSRDSPSKARIPTQHLALQSPQGDNNNLLSVEQKRDSFSSQRSSRVRGPSKNNICLSEIPHACLLPHHKTSKNIQFIIKSLKQHSLFSKLTKETLESIASCMALYSLQPGEFIYKENEAGASMYIINSGFAEELKSGAKPRSLGSGQLLGENALVQDHSHDYTVKAGKNLTLWRIKRAEYVSVVESLNIQNYSEYKSFIENIPIFSTLTQQQQESLLELLMPQEFKHAQQIIEEGRQGDLFYIIREGEVKCSKKCKEVRRLGKGEYFGEQALIYDVPRTATVIALGYVKVLALKREALTHVLGDQLVNVIYRNSLRIAFDRSSVFAALSKLQREKIIEKMQTNSYKKHHEMNIQLGTEVVVVLRGCFECNGTEHREFNLIGDDELLEHNEGATAVCRALHKTDFAFISKEDIEGLLQDSLKDVISLNQVTKVLSTVKLLQSLPLHKLEAVARQMIVREFQPNEVIFHAGDPGTELFIIKSGQVNVQKEQKTIRTLESLNFFGERAILLSEPRTATVIASVRTLSWVLSQETFLNLIDPSIKNLLMKRMLLQDDTIQLSDLYMVKKLGNGTFGNVFLTVNSKNKVPYALKTVSRQKICAYELYDNLLYERKVLIQLDHHMLMKLVKTFKDEQRIYLLLEYVRGLDFFDVLRALNLLSDGQARFYIGCLLLIVEHLHGKHMLYRDFKPENIVIDENGYPKLVDFGACKIISGRTFTTIGTPHYMAPEVISGMGYSFAADYWTLGVMLYEFVVGHVPFGNDCEEPFSIYEAILNQPLQFPTGIRSRACQPLATQLLDRTPGMRGSIESLKKNEFFKVLDWDNLFTKTVRAPYIPSLKSLNRELEKAAQKKQLVFSDISKEELYDREPRRPRSSMQKQPRDWDAEF